MHRQRDQLRRSLSCPGEGGGVQVQLADDLAVFGVRLCVAPGVRLVVSKNDPRKHRAGGAAAGALPPTD